MRLRRARFWIALAAVLVAGGLLIGALAGSPGTPLDPGSASGDGSEALAHVLARFGVDVRATHSITGALDGAADDAVLVTDPDTYSTAQLHQLANGAGRLVLVRPGTRSLAAVTAGAQPDDNLKPDDQPGCAEPGAQATGTVQLPGDTRGYLAGDSGLATCYGGALLTGDRVAVLGTAEALRNDRLADEGVAAYDINAITGSRRYLVVRWLLPGADAAGSGPASVWDLFPGGAYRAFWWLVGAGVLLAVWRARRLGGVVSEPLPVIVRSAELVEGHGRLYARAGARDRAAAALRAATTRRLAARLGLPRGTPAEQVAAATGREPQAHAALAGPPPDDDAALMRLATELDELEDL